MVGKLTAAKPTRKTLAFFVFGLSSSYFTRKPISRFGLADGNINRQMASKTILNCRSYFFQPRFRCGQFKGSVAVQQVTAASPKNCFAKIRAEKGDSFHDIHDGQQPPRARPVRYFYNR